MSLDLEVTAELLAFVDSLPESKPPAAPPPEGVIREASELVNHRTGVAIHRGWRLVFDVHCWETMGGKTESAVGLLVGWGPA